MRAVLGGGYREEWGIGGDFIAKKVQAPSPIVDGGDWKRRITGRSVRRKEKVDVDGVEQGGVRIAAGHAEQNQRSYLISQPTRGIKDH